MTENYFDPTQHQEPELEQAGWYPLEIVGLQRVRAKTKTEGFQFVFQILLTKAAGMRLRETFWDTETALPRLGTFTTRFYKGPPYSLSDPEAMWNVYGGARVYGEIGFKPRSDGTRGYPEIRRFGAIPEALRVQLVAIPRIAPPSFPEGMLVTKDMGRPREDGDYPPSPGDTQYGGSQYGSTHASGTQDDDIPF